MSNIEKTAPALPALYDAQTEIGTEDIRLPRVKIGQFMSAAVQEQLIAPGVIFSSLGADDGDPVALWDPKAKGENPGLLFHVLDMRKGLSLSDGGELQTWRFGDPDAPTEAWTTYDFAVCLPEADPDLPYKLLFTRSGRAAAEKINLVLKKGAARGPAHGNAFRLTSSPRENDKGKFFVPRVQIVEAQAAYIKTSEELAVLIASTPAEPVATGVEPGI